MATLHTGDKSTKKNKAKTTPMYYTFTFRGEIDDIGEYFSFEETPPQGFELEIDGTAPWTDERLAMLIQHYADAGYGGRVGNLLTDYELVDIGNGELNISLIPHGTQGEL